MSNGVRPAALAFRGLSGHRLLGVAIAIFLIGLFVSGFGVDSPWPPDWERLAIGEGTLPARVEWALRQLSTDPADFCRFMADEQRVFQKGTWSEITQHRAYVWLTELFRSRISLSRERRWRTRSIHFPGTSIKDFRFF